MLLTNKKKKNILYLDVYRNEKRGEYMGMSETLKAISDPARRNILEMLKQCNRFLSSVYLKKGRVNSRNQIQEIYFL